MMRRQQRERRRIKAVARWRRALILVRFLIRLPVSGSRTGTNSLLSHSLCPVAMLRLTHHSPFLAPCALTTASWSLAGEAGELREERHSHEQEIFSMLTMGIHTRSIRASALILLGLAHSRRPHCVRGRLGASTQMRLLSGHPELLCLIARMASRARMRSEGRPMRNRIRQLKKRGRLLP